MLLNCKLKLLLLHISASTVEPQGCQQEGDLIQCLALFITDPPPGQKMRVKGRGDVSKGVSVISSTLDKRVKGPRGHLWPAGANVAERRRAMGHPP